MRSGSLVLGRSAFEPHRRSESGSSQVAEAIVSLLARCRVSEQENLVRSHMMDRRGEGVTIILDESRDLPGRIPEYTLLDDSELRLVIWSAGLPVSSTT